MLLVMAGQKNVLPLLGTDVQHMPDFPFKTPPFGPYQLSEFNDHGTALNRALIWEQGTGKSWPTVQSFAYLYQCGYIDTVVIIAPSGVASAWIMEQVKQHFPDHLLHTTRTLIYNTSKHNTQTHIDACNSALAHKGLLIVAMTYDAAITDPSYSKNAKTGRKSISWKGGKGYLSDLLSLRRVFLIADESIRIKNPNAQRTKTLLRLAPFAAYRRILNGTPIGNSPFDLYAQLKFLDQGFWFKHGIGSWTAFKNHFGSFQTEYGLGGRPFQKLTGYKNLEQLKEILASIGTRYTKEEVLDLPPKVYSTLSFDLTPTQRRMYEELENDFITYFDDGRTVSSPLAITRMLRFQQFASGFVPVDDAPDDYRFIDLPGGNPRLDLLNEMVQDVPHSTVIWSRFIRSIDHIADMIKSNGLICVRYDGTVDEEDREKNKAAFMAGDAQFMLATAACGGVGQTWIKGKSAWYYENTYRAIDRAQSEDRLHRIGQDNKVGIVDLVAAGTIDSKIIESLKKNFDIAAIVTGDADKKISAAA
jgi:SNF2 family DNA or RNA helicase